MLHTALTIAGSDSSGGAGIQADIKTMTAHGIYAMSAITALTAQNTLGVSAVSEVSPDFLAAQLDSIFTDIIPEATKIGMISSAALIEVVVDRLSFYRAKNLVIDPVMIATSGSRLLKEAAMECLKKRLLPMASVITPNIPEAEALCGRTIRNACDMEQAAKALHEAMGCAVLVKGGHCISDANDYLYDGAGRWFHGQRIDNQNTHGTGCTLSSAIASNLAKGCPLEEAIARAKTYISGCLAAMLNLGRGAGPMNHMFAWTGKDDQH